MSFPERQTPIEHCAQRASRPIPGGDQQQRRRSTYPAIDRASVSRRERIVAVFPRRVLSNNDSTDSSEARRRASPACRPSAQSEPRVSTRPAPPPRRSSIGGACRAIRRHPHSTGDHPNSTREAHRRKSAASDSANTRTWAPCFRKASMISCWSSAQSWCSSQMATGNRSAIRRRNVRMTPNQGGYVA